MVIEVDFPDWFHFRLSVSVSSSNPMDIAVAGLGMGRSKLIWTNKIGAKACWGLLGEDLSLFLRGIVVL